MTAADDARARVLAGLPEAELARMHAANGGLMGEASYRKWTKDELVRAVLEDEEAARAWDNREHVRALLAERQPGLAAALEAAVRAA